MKKQRSKSHSRTKGHGFERAIVNVFKDAGYNATRVLEYQVHECLGVDVMAKPFMIQTKAYKDYCPISKINEVRREGIPVLITKGDRKEPMIVMPLSEFIKGLKDFGHFKEGVNE